MANNTETVVEVNRSDLIFLQRVLDSCFAEVEAIVREGNEDESILIEIDEALNAVKGYLR